MKRPDELQLVQQPFLSKQCGAACCAMLVGKTLAEVLAQWNWKRLAFITGIAEFLATHDIILGMGIHGEGLDLYAPTIGVDLVPEHHTALLGVSVQNENTPHWMLWDRERYLDPSPHPHRDYIIEQLWPITYWEGCDIDSIPDHR